MSLIDKLISVQSELKVPKNQFNKFGGYKYRSCEDIVEAVKPLLVKNGLLMTISDKIEFHSDMRVYVCATVRITDGSDSIEAHGYARESATKKGMDDSQITGSTSSYARKYALNGMFGIDDTKDADATNDHGKKSSSQKAAPAQNSSELLSIMSNGNDIETAKYWRSLDQEEQGRQWQTLDKQSQNALKALLSKQPAQGN